MKIITFSFYVFGSSRFPVDMLRYDGVIPATESDSGNIERTFTDGGVPQKIKLTKQNGYLHWTPSSARWSTFGWTVIGGE